MLEPQVFRFRESFTFFYLLGMSCLLVGDTGGAYSYLSRARTLVPDDIDTLLGLAAVFLKKQDTQQALSTWFLILDKDPKNKKAQRGLKLLRKYADTSDLVDAFESAQFYKIVPVPSAGRTILARIVFLSLILLLGGAAVIGIYTYLPSFTAKPQREGVRTLTLQSAAITDNSNMNFSFSKRELQKEILKIKEYFNNFEDNKAMLEINRVLLSNADPAVKKEVLLLKGYLKAPTFSTLATSYSYAEVVEQPLLYEGCYVRWKGRVSNLVTTKTYIGFDLLVGYEKGTILRGIVPVKLNFAVKIDPALAIEVLGQIHVSQKKILLTGVSIHQFQ